MIDDDPTDIDPSTFALALRAEIEKIAREQAEIVVAAEFARLEAAASRR